MAWKTRRRIVATKTPPPTPPVMAEPKEWTAEPIASLDHRSGYDALLERRYRTVDPNSSDGDDIWTWIASDDGAWDGPANDWKTSHSTRYFEHLKNCRSVITAGANQGMYVRFYAKKFQTVYAFEPDPLNFHCMVMNNQADNVVKMNCALGEAPGFCKVSRHNQATNTGTWTVDRDDHAHIPILTLDSLMIPDLDLLQLDVEGYESNIILGGLASIERCKPVIILENGHKDDVKAMMNSIGYVYRDQSVSDAIFISEK